MRFLIAFGILLGARGPVAVGWALFLCLWKIADILDDLKPKKPDTANAASEARRGETHGQ
jgi:hypothetical protein